MNRRRIKLQRRIGPPHEVCCVKRLRREPSTARSVKVRHQRTLTMAFPFDLQNMDLEKQVRMLRGELASLQELAARRGKDVYGGASGAISGYYDDLSRVATSLLPGLGRRGKMVDAAAFNHPAAVAAVGLLVVGLVASLFVTQRLASEPSKTEPSIPKRTRSRTQAAASKKTANARNASSRGTKRSNGPTRDTEPKADQPPDL